jgi:hypothetical protein
VPHDVHQQCVHELDPNEDGNCVSSAPSPIGQA